LHIHRFKNFTILAAYWTQWADNRILCNYCTICLQ